MSNGEDTDDAGDATDAGDEEAVSPDVFEQRLDDVAEAVETAETEGDLDAVDETLDAVEADLDDATLSGEDDDDDDPREDLEDRLGDLRDEVEEKRGPYVEDITDVLGTAEGTIQTSEWTEEGETEVATAVAAFFETAKETLDESFELAGDPPESVVAEDVTAEKAAADLSAASETIGETDLDPDDDAEAIATLLEAADTLTDALDDAQVFDDLEVREQLERLGFYDVLTPETRMDYPPEWNAVKLYEARGEIEPILTAFEKLDSDFMQENILDALEHLGSAEAFDEVHALAKRRSTHPVRVLGRMGDERACGTLEGFLGGRDVALEKESLRALGAIGSEDSTEPVAQRLAAENPEVRTAAARSLGLIGDTRAIEPLADLLDGDETEQVRASAAWALTQIGTERALDVVAEHQDDRSYLVQEMARSAQTP